MLTKAEILHDIRAEWLLLEHQLSGLTEAQMTAPGAIADWSIKDTLAHLSAWQKVLLDQLGAAISNRPAGFPSIRSPEDVDLMNAHFFTENRDRSLPAVLMECRSLHTAVLTVVEAMDESMLALPIPADWAEDAPTFRELICANTCDHYREHRLQLEQRGFRG